MSESVSTIVDILRRTPSVLRAMLANLPDELTNTNYGRDTFSPADVLGHLIEGERYDWIPRARVILEQGEQQTFEPFDRYSMFESCKGMSITELLDTFEQLRTESLDVLQAMSLGADQLARTGRHPEFGRVTLGQLLSTWTVHDLHHTAQICKAMSYQYRDAVGPWRAYLGIIPTH